jgi:LPXTG-site transpeptidase (sortase) family protein
VLICKVNRVIINKYMTEDTPIKKYPQTTAEVAHMLGLHPAGENLPMGSFSAADLPVAGLPVVKDTTSGHLPADKAAHEILSSGDAAKTDSHSSAHSELISLEEKKAKQPLYAKVGKALLPYAAIFLVGTFLYYFFFTKVDFTTMFNSAPKAAAPQVTEIQKLEQQDIVSYNKWIASYYYDVSDPKLLDPEADNSGNGLSNFQKYLMNLNPKAYDTLGLGQADSQAIASGINPLTGGQLTDAQKTVVSKYIDMEVVMNRLTLYNMENPSQVAGASIGVGNNNNPSTSSGSVDNNISGNNNYNNNVNNSGNNNSNSGINNIRGNGDNNSNNNNISGNNNPSTSSGSVDNNNRIAGNNNYNGNNNTGMGGGIVNGGSVQTIRTAPTTGANLTTISDSQVNIDTSKPGLLEIPDLKIKVPLIWSKDPNNFDQDLQVGVVHYPGTALPGEVGTTYIAGHSSNYSWAKGSYNKIFSTLGNMALNTSFKITVVQTNGKNAVFNYVVTKSQQYTATDEAQFQNTEKSVVALSTCWPVGSTAKRLVVFGTLTQVEE